MPYIETISPDREMIELRASFHKLDADTLVIPRQSGNAIDVRLNGRLIYTLGDFSQPTANLWNYIHLIHLTEPLAEENLLNIRIASSFFASGLNSVPYLCRYEQCAGRVALLNWIYSDTLNIIFGAGLITGFILVAMALIRQNLVSTEFFIGFALLLGVFFLQDLPFRLTTGSISTFLWAKKIFLMSGYLATVSFLCGIELQYRKRIKLGHWLAIIALFIVLILFVSPDIYSISFVQTYANLVILIYLILTMGVIVRSKERPSWMLFPVTLLSLSILLVLIALPVGITWPVMVPSVFVVMNIIIGIRLILEYNQMFRENLSLRREKNIDPLTGVLNRNVLPELRANLHDYLVVIDLDRFKLINDRYGHAFGDQILTEFTRVVRQNLRQNDLVIRFGGDEFVLVLNNLPRTQQGQAEVVSILERIRKQYTVLHKDILLGFSYGITAIYTSIDEAIKEADRQMYQMKETRKTSRG